MTSGCWEPWVSWRHILVSEARNMYSRCSQELRYKVDAGILSADVSLCNILALVSTAPEKIFLPVNIIKLAYKR